MTEQRGIDDDRIDDAKATDAGTSSDVAPSQKIGEPWNEPAIHQLDSMIENIAGYATPVLREIAARAAELAAKAGDAAGPMAHKAADKTEEIAGRVATRGREVASDLRGETTVAGSASGEPPSEPR
jgi:hypothetical protein